LAERTAFVAIEGADLVDFIAGHTTRRLGCDGELQWINVARQNGAGVAGQLMTIGMWEDTRVMCTSVDA
jgi:hypothetical protein